MKATLRRDSKSDSSSTPGPQRPRLSAELLRKRGREDGPKPPKLISSSSIWSPKPTFSFSSSYNNELESNFT
jgi:hypothetical protein